MDTGYIEACVAALPAEKRPAARAAFRELIEEGGSDHLLSRLLLVFEATSAFASKIPAEITSAMERCVGALDARLKTLAESETAGATQQFAHIRALFENREAAPASDPALERLAAGVQAQSVELGRVAAAVSRFRHARVHSFIGFVVIAFLGGAAAVAGGFYKDYTNAVGYRRFWRSIQSRNVTVSSEVRGRSFVLRVDGPPVHSGTEWVRDTGGKSCGVELYFPEP